MSEYFKACSDKLAGLNISDVEKENLIKACVAEQEKIDSGFVSDEVENGQNETSSQENVAVYTDTYQMGQQLETFTNKSKYSINAGLNVGGGTLIFLEGENDVLGGTNLGLNFVLQKDDNFFTRLEISTLNMLKEGPSFGVFLLRLDLGLDQQLSHNINFTYGGDKDGFSAKISRVGIREYIGGLLEVTSAKYGGVVVGAEFPFKCYNIDSEGYSGPARFGSAIH